MKVGLFFGSFNPVHNGHLAIADFFATKTDLSQIWFVVSPQNPLKEKEELADENHRLKMVELAIEGNEKFRASTVEFGLPRPSYTITTLEHFSKNFPEDEFVLLLGGDSLKEFHKWKSYEKILNGFAVYVYRRSGFDDLFLNQPAVQIFDVPEISISATMIRERIHENLSVDSLVPPAVLSYLRAKKLFH